MLGRASRGGLSRRRRVDRKPRGAQALPLGRADLLDPRVGPLLQVGVAGVTRLLVRVVAGGIVAADERPARLVAGVAVGAVQEVAMEEEGIARLEFAVDPLQPP